MKFRECVTRMDEVKFYIDENPPEARITLDLLTNPLGCPGRVLSCLASVNSAAISRYNTELPELKSALAAHSGIEEDQIMITSGADQAIEIVLTHILERKETLGIRIPTFPRFEIVARRLCDATIQFFRNLDVPKDCKAVFLCTPNNPTTEELPLQELETVIQNNKDTFFLIDSVFSDFGQENVSRLIRKFDHIAVLKSLSKSFGLPGMRVGWIESQRENIQAFRQGVSPFRVPPICQKLAAEALKDPEHITRTIEFLSKEFQKIEEAFGEKVTRKSPVPFYLLHVEEPQKAREWLLQQGIRVVDSTSFNGVEKGFLRITIGTEEENKVLISALKQFLQENEY